MGELFLGLLELGLLQLELVLERVDLLFSLEELLVLPLNLLFCFLGAFDGGIGLSAQGCETL